MPRARSPSLFSEAPPSYHALDPDPAPILNRQDVRHHIHHHPSQCAPSPLRYQAPLPTTEYTSLQPPPLPPSLYASPTRHHPSHSRSHPPPPNPPAHLPDLAAGLRPLAHTPVLILGVQSDILFPVEQQREVADALRVAGNERVSYYELGGVWGHDTFL